MSGLTDLAPSRVAVDELDDRWHVLLTADDADDAALAERRGEHAGDVAALVLGEQDAGMFVGYVVRNWSMPMKLTSGLASAAASVSVVRRKPTVITTSGWPLEGRGDVRLVVGLADRLDVARLDAEALDGSLHAVVGELVERAVVDLADVGDEGDLEALGCLEPLVLGAALVERDLAGGLASGRRRLGRRLGGGGRR